jgi:hypothetical protein
MNAEAEMKKGIPVPGKWTAAILVFPYFLEPPIRVKGIFRPSMKETPSN